MVKGTIIGMRAFSGVGKTSGKPFSGFELCVRRGQGFAHREFIGQQVDSFTVFENACGDYRPKPGDGISYHLYRQNGNLVCGFVLHDPDLDEG